MVLFKSLSTKHPYLNLVDINWNLIVYYMLESWEDIKELDTVSTLKDLKPFREEETLIWGPCVHKTVSWYHQWVWRKWGKLWAFRRTVWSPYLSHCHCLILPSFCSLACICFCNYYSDVSLPFWNVPEKDCALLVLFSVPVSALPAKHMLELMTEWIMNGLIGETLKERGE